MLVYLDKVHEPVHNTLPVSRPAVLEVDQCGVNVVTPGSEKQTISEIQFPLLKKPLPNSNFSDQRDCHHFDLCATIFTLLLFLMGPSGLWGQQA